MFMTLILSNSLTLCHLLATRGKVYILVTLWILWQVVKLLRMYSKRPLNAYIGGTSILLLGKWFTSLEFVVDGAGMISNIYKMVGKSNYSSTILEQIIRHRHTMFGFEHNSVDPNNDVPKRVLKVLLRMNLPHMQDGLQPLIRDIFSRELTARDSDGWSQASAFNLSKHLVTRLNSHVLLGSKLASDHRFEDTVNRYLQDAVVTMELCRHLPSFLASLVAPAIMRWSGAMHSIGRFVAAEVENRVANSHASDIRSKPRDCIQWVIESSRTAAQRTVTRLTQQIIGILFASAHQMSAALVYAIFDLCLHPEFIEPLREEMERARSATNYEDHFDHLPLMDSFLRESARLNPLDALSIQRIALSPYTFSDGTHVPAGNLVAVPQAAVMQDPRHYAEPKKFDPYRFLTVDETDGSMRALPKYTDVHWNYPYWGSAKRACPGRWYVSRSLKQILSHLIMEYNFKLADRNAPRAFVWTTAVVPRFNTKLMLQARK